VASDAGTRPPRPPAKPPPWRDVRTLRIAFQVAFLVGVGLLLWYLYGNLVANLRRSGLPTGYGFLDQPTGFPIRDTPFRASQPVLEGFRTALINTLQVSLIGIALTTVVGILVGIGRLSSNWLVRKVCAFYVEAIRNVPTLVVILFMYLAVVLRLPGITDAAEWFGAVVLSNRRVVVPWGDAQANAGAFLAVLAVALVAAVAVGLWRTRVFDDTGKPHHRVLWGGAVLVAAAAVAYLLLDRPVTLSLPVRDGRVIDGGIGVGPEFTALLLGLVIYTASHIAEIVRGSILAVPKGQTEAAYAIALSGFQRMRFVVLPQAFRIMVPPLANQYLNLMKNSSLAVVIGYQEITQFTKQVISAGSPAPQAISVLMLIYLGISLSISLVTNLVNRRLALESR
jgi:general L-amino acid transport system permease protein